MDAKEAARKAKEYLASFSIADSNAIYLEEIERIGNEWRVTLSYPDPDPVTADLVGRRKLRVIEFDGLGEVKSMKIWQAA